MENSITVCWTECLCSLLQFLCWSPSPPCVGIWKWELEEVIKVRWGHTGGALMKGLASLNAEESEALPLHHVRTQQEVVQARKRALTKNQYTGTCDLGLPASRTVRKKCLLFKPLSLWYFVRTTEAKPLGLKKKIIFCLLRTHLLNC